MELGAYGAHGRHEIPWSGTHNLFFLSFLDMVSPICAQPRFIDCPTYDNALP